MQNLAGGHLISSVAADVHQGHRCPKHRRPADPSGLKSSPPHSRISIPTQVLASCSECRMTPCRARETCLQADILDFHAQYSQAAERSNSKDNAPDHARGFRTLPQFGGLSLGHQRCQNNDAASKAAPSRAFCGLVFHTAHKLLYHSDGSAASP
jgi:hypothetical protein